jgi:hypothetical protein
VNARNESPLSRVELVVLAAMSQAKPPTEKMIARTVSTVLRDLPSGAAANALRALKTRGFVTNDTKLTESGARALRSAFDLDRAPKWAEARKTYLPALTLDMKVNGALDTAGLELVALAKELRVPVPPSVQALCDTLVAEALGMPRGPLTLASIRAHMLAKHGKVEATGGPAIVAKRITRRIVDVKRREQFANALLRHWLLGGESTQSRGPQPTPPTFPSGPIDYLAAVRDALPKIGPEGRFGPEQVYVAALWRRLDHDRSLGGLSLDKFKRWLVTANREQSLLLIRADLVTVMNPKLVAESEIEDLGATFHFVADPRAVATGKRNHAR